MGMLARKGFPVGWTPNADAVDAPPGALLRMDNCVLDDLNILSLRRGVLKRNSSPFSQLDVHSLLTIELNGSEIRMAGASDKVLANETALSPTMAGVGDIQFGTHMGQIFFARSTSKWKYDGTTVRKWGIDGPSDAATITAGGGSSDSIVSYDSDEDPALTWTADDGSGAAYADDRNATANGSAVLKPGSGSFGDITKTWATDQDLTDLPSITATDDTIVSIWVYVSDIFNNLGVGLRFSLEDDPTGNTYSFEWFGPYYGGDVDEGNGQTRVNFVNGWNKLTARRGNFRRFGSDFGLGWSTVRAVHTYCYGTEGSVEYRFDDLRFTGGEGSVLDGEYQWVYVYVRDDGSYVIQSAPSPETDPETFQGQSAVLTIPADSDRDTQINQIWLFRRGGNLDQYYRTEIYSGTISTSSIDITDDTSDQDALDADVTLQLFNEGPPDNIVDIEGPYYDRLFVLTATDLYPSRRLDPDVFATNQIIRISGPDERAVWVKKAFNGLYIGTTKDIYRLDGTGAELPDGTVEFQLTPLNIDHPPTNNAVAQEGNLLVFFAADGWRAFNGAGSQNLTGSTSKLYQGEDRHGISTISKGTGRFVAIISHGQLIAVTPEGASSTTSTVLYRYVFATQQWYRHVYSFNFRSLFAEPNGTIIAGDDAGYIREIDTGTDDDGDPSIAVTVWTARDDDDSPYSPKQAVGFSINLDAGVRDYTYELYSNDDGTLLKTGTSGSNTLQPKAFNVADIAVFRQLQLRLTGTFRTFRFSGFVVPYLALPMGVKAWDSGPMDLGQQDMVWLRRVKIKARAGADLTVTPYFDDVEFNTVTIEPAVGKTSIYDVPVGRSFFGRVPRLVITSTEDFYPYWVEFEHRKTTEETEKALPRIPCGLGGEADA